MPNLSGKVCLVTGATRGIGRGIALQLAQAGAIVYITGRRQQSLNKVIEELKERGAGKAVGIQCDHNDDEAVRSLFDQIKNDENGQLDLLVNNAYAAVEFMIEQERTPVFAMDPVEAWDLINGVGLRNHYICTALGSKMMVSRKTGLIVNISSPGGLRYIHNTPYGIGKAACDRMAADCAVDLKKHNVAMISLWPGPVRTETIVQTMEERNWQKMKDIFGDGETTEFAGIGIAHLAADPNIMSMSGKILLTINLARDYGFEDIDGRLPPDYRSLKTILKKNKWAWLSWITPEFIRIPMVLLHYASYKF